MKNFLIISCLLILQTIVLAAEKITIIDVKGSGQTRAEAIENGLIEAVKQTKGVHIKSQKNFIQNISKQKKLGTNGNSKELNIKSFNQKKIQEATQGLINEYRIINEQKISDSQFEVKLSVKILEYKIPGNSNSNRYKIVVTPTINNKSYNILEEYKSSRDLQTRLNQEIISSITQTRKFSILERENDNAFNKEMGLIVDRNTKKEELLKLGNVLGADFLIVTDIKNFKIFDDFKIKKITGKKISNIKAEVNISYRVLTLATKQIKMSNTISFNIEVKGKSENEIYSKVLKVVGDRLRDELISNIYPLKITKISDNGDAIISSKLVKGDTYDVYSLGDKLFDDYTKEFLGYDEVKTGQVKIVRVLPKISFGKVINGVAKKGNVCRKIEQVIQEPKNNQSKSSLSSKKYLIVKDLTFSSNVSKNSKSYLKNSNIKDIFQSKLNVSKEYTILSRDLEKIQEISKEQEEFDVKTANFFLTPKILAFDIENKSNRLDDSTIYENTEYFKMELNVIIINKNLEVVFDKTESEIYTRSWASKKSIKKGTLSRKVIEKISIKLIDKIMNQLLKQEKESRNRNLTVIEVSDGILFIDLFGYNNIKNGEEFLIYKKPKIRINKRTGKSRIRYGKKIGRAKIDGIFDGEAEAIVINGKIEDVKEGYILKKQ